MLVHHRPPGDETEADAIVEHREATTRQVKRMAIHTADRVPVGRFAIAQSSVGLDRTRDRREFADAHGGKKAGVRRDLLALTVGEVLLEQESESLASGLPHLGTERMSTNVRPSTGQLLIEPGGADGIDLPLDRER